MADRRNEAERLLNAAMDHIAGTLEQPADQRAWDHLLIYCPREALERRINALEVPPVRAALAYADGYKAALDDCERADVAKLIEKIAALEGKLSFEKALRSIAERNFEQQAMRIVELEDGARHPVGSVRSGS